MAYLTILAAVPEERILAFERDPDQSLKASLVRGVSHLIAYWVKVQPLGKLLGEVIDGGKELHDSLWHPLRPPLFHEPTRTKEFSTELAKEWHRVTLFDPVPEKDWYRLEIEKVLEVLDHATQRNSSIVSYLEPPQDLLRAWRVRLPCLE